MNTQKSALHEEISFSDIVLKLWFRRGLILAICAMSFVLGTCLSVIVSKSFTSPVLHFVELVGINKKQYANGAVFSPNDLLSPEVLRSVAERYEIEDVSSLLDAIDVTFASPSTSGIIDKYKQQMNTKNLTPAEVDIINTNLEEELRAVTEQTLKISVLPKKIGISDQAVMELAGYVPKAWERFYVDRFNLAKPSSPVFAKNLGDVDLGSAQEVVKIAKNIDRINEILGAILEDKRLSSLETAEGVNAAEVKANLEHVYELKIIPILKEYASKGDSTVLNYFDYLAGRQRIVESLLASNLENIKSIQSMITRDSPAVEMTAGQSRELVQFSGGFLDKIISLADQAEASRAFVENLQSLYSERKDLQAKSSVQSNALARLQVTTVSTENSPTNDALLKTSAEAELSSVMADFSELMQSRQELLFETGVTLMQPIGSPYKLREPFLTNFTLKIIIVSGMFGFILSAALGLLLPIQKTH